MTKVHTFVLNLRRDSPNEQWGFSLVGGSDQGAPLIVTKVNFGSPVVNNLQRGDIISKIGNYDSRDVRHQDAQNLFKNAGTNIKVVVQRETSNRHNTSTASSRCSSQTPLSISPNLSPRGPQQSFNSPGGSATYMPTLQPYHTEPFPVLSEGYYKEYVPGSKPKRNEDEELEHVVNQPIGEEVHVYDYENQNTENQASNHMLYIRNDTNPLKTYMADQKCYAPELDNIQNVMA